MSKILVAILTICFCVNSVAQNNLKSEYYIQRVFEEEYNNLDNSLLYMDSLAMLNEASYWEAKLIKAEVYSRISDSVNRANELIEECIDYYESSNDFQLLMITYTYKARIAESLNKGYDAIETLNTAIKAANIEYDSVYISYFELQIGFIYMTLIGDTVYSLEHINRGLNISVAIENWIDAVDANYQLMEYYFKKRDTAMASIMSDQLLEYSSNIDSMDGYRYHGDIYKADFYHQVGQPKEAIKHGHILVDKGKELNDPVLYRSGYGILAESYFEINELEKAYGYSTLEVEAAEERSDIPELRNAYKIHWQICEAKGLLKESLYSLKKYQECVSLLHDETVLAKVTHELYSGEIERRELEKSKVQLALGLSKEKAKLSNEKSKFKTSMIIGISIILLVLAIYSVILFRKKRKEVVLNKELTASNEVISAQKEQLIENVDELRKDLSEKEHEEDSFYFPQSAIQIRFEDIIMLESSNNYVLVHVVGRKNPLLERVKMIELVKEFPVSVFIKVHRSFYVNVNQIISRPSKYLVKMSNDADVNISRNYVVNLGDKFL